MPFNSFAYLTALKSGTAYQQSASGDWRFDPLSFVLGLVAALLLTALAYRNRERLAQQRDQIKARLSALRERLTANMATRYSANVTESAQTIHLLSALAPFDDIHVETALQPVLTADLDDTRPPLLTPWQAIQAKNRLAIIGPAGSGRTSLLIHMLLEQARRLQQDTGSERVPVYVYLPVLARTLAAESREFTADTVIHQLADTALASMSRVVATGVVRWLTAQIKEGRALLLLDGWDEVAPADRPVILSWMQALLSAQPDNTLIVTGGERGYGPLVEAGLTPLQPAPWNRRQFAQLSRRWQAALNSESAGDEPIEIAFGLMPPTPLEATIELVIRLRGQQPAPTPAHRMAQMIDLLLPAPQPDEKGQTAWPLQTGQRALDRLAFAALQQGWLTLERQEIQSTVAEAMPPPQYAPDALEDKSLTREEQKAAREEQDQRVLQVVDCCRALTATGAPIRSWDNQHYLFTHPLVAAYLAARHLVSTEDDPLESLAAHAAAPLWRDVLRFYAGLADAGPVVQHLMSAPDDLFLGRLWAASAALAASAPGRAPWRVALIKRLAQLMMAPQAPAPLRDRAMQALIQSNEPGIGLLFQQSVKRPDPFLRACGVLGLGALGREQDLPLIEAALGHDDPDVQMAAVNALSLLTRNGSQAALELIVTTMIASEGLVQQIAAEALADLEPDGHELLRDAARDQDLMVRRAAVFGLAAVKDPWAVALLREMQQNDDEWLVRNAAAEALDSLGWVPDLALPQPETESWLIEWAAERGEGTGVGDAAYDALFRALHEGEPLIRYRAAKALGRLAPPRAIGALRQHLRDPEPAVRDAALAALEEIARRHDITITAKG